MDIAVAFEKINIDDYYCIFKPQGIIRGLFDSKSRTFESEFGLVFDMMQDGLVDGENYFAFPTTFSEIKKRLGDNVAEDTLLAEYLNICTDNCYIGYYDSQDLIIKVKQIPFELIEKSNLSDFYSQDETLITFSFSTQYIEELINSNSLDEVKEKLGAIVDLAHRIEKNREKIETETDEKEKNQKNYR